MKENKKVLNELFVEIYNDIAQIEEKTLKNGPISDLSVTEVHTIEAIGMYTKRSMSEIAKDLKITVGTLTTAINKLIKKEYVQRERPDEDRRVVLVKVTPKGKLAYRLHEKFHNDMINEITRGLTDEQEDILLSALGGLNKYFKEKYKLNKE